VQDFAQHFHQPPDKLGPEQLRQYQAHLFQDQKLNAGTVQQYVAALRFFFNKTLKRRYPLVLRVRPAVPEWSPSHEFYLRGGIERSSV